MSTDAQEPHFPKDSAILRYRSGQDLDSYDPPCGKFFSRGRDGSLSTLPRTRCVGFFCMTERYVRNPKIEEAPLGSDIMLFDPAKSQFYVLNSTMAYLWRHCEGEFDMEGIVKSIPGEFALSDGAPVAADMKAGLDELLALGMITKG